jgi:hypothetical protein
VPAISPDGTRVAFISDRKVSSQGNVFVLDIASGQIRQVTDEADLTHNVEDRGAGARVYAAQLSNPLPRPAFGTAKGAIYLGDKGKLWRVDAATGKRDEVTFSADIAFEFFPGSPPPVYSEKPPASPTSILTPRLTPDGTGLIFTAAGYLWRQSLTGGAARRLLDTGGFEWGPAVLSPDGKRLAYQLSEGDTRREPTG